MYLEIYYFSFPLIKKYKENTILKSIKQDLHNFFIYNFWESFENFIKLNNLESNLFISQNNNYIIPKLIFELEWDLNKIQIKEIFDIFLSHWSENFLINTNIENQYSDKFLQTDNIDNILNNAKEIFNDFIHNYSKNKLIDENEPDYIKFRKYYNMLLFLHYNLVKNYKETTQVKKYLTNIKSELAELKSHKELLKKRIQLDKENLEKIIVIYDQFITKIIKIIENL